MYRIEQYQTAVTLFKRNGDVRVFKNKEEAYRALGWEFLGAKVGTEFRRFQHFSTLWVEEESGEMGQRTFPVYAEFDCILRDDFGCPLTLKDFADVRAKLRARTDIRRYYFYRFSQLERWNGKGPVPGVHRPGNSHYFRHPKTRNEKRLAQVIVPDEIPPRAKRNRSNLASEWDDRLVASRDERSWKKFRKTRWKP